METKKWKSNFYSNLISRNSFLKYKEVFDTYKSLVQKYETLHNDFSKLQFKHQELINSSPSGNDKDKPINQIREYEDKIYNLQEELTKHFREKSENAQTLLDLTKELKLFKKDLENEKQKTDKLSSENQKLKNSKTELEKDVEKKDQTINYLRGEMIALRTDIKKKDEILEKLNKDNKELLTRILEQKQSQVDAMNKVNDLNEIVQKKEQELQKLQEKYKVVSSITSDICRSVARGKIFRNDY
jgi:chromosome segregation protein